MTITKRDNKIEKSLRRYYSILENRTKARYLVARRIPIKEFSWREHSRAIKQFEIIKNKIDLSKEEIENLRIPKKSLLDLKIELAKQIMSKCELCEHLCKVNRWKGEKGFCQAGDKLTVSSQFWHHGEERFFVPSYTIFMGNKCSFRCLFCQNFDISQLDHFAEEFKPQELAWILDEQRRKGVLNWNWVGSEPTPSLFFILITLKYCNENCPNIWNSNFYMSEKSMQLLKGIVDVYLSDFKYGDDKCAKRLSKVDNYLAIVKRNHLLAFKDSELVIRHLILPNHFNCCSKPILDFIAKNFRDKVIVNLMDQYRPEYKAMQYKDINRSVTEKEFEQVVNYAKKLNLNFIT